MKHEAHRLTVEAKEKVFEAQGAVLKMPEGRLRNTAKSRLLSIRYALEDLDNMFRKEERDAKT